MKKSVQAGKYIVSDFIASSVVWLLFNLIRYEEVAVYEGFDTVGAFLLHIPSLKGQLLIPFFWFVLYWFSGYYNKPFGKSRLTELFSTLGSVSIGVVILFFALVLNDLPRSYHVYYDMFFSLWGLQFVLTYIPPVIDYAGRVTEDKVQGMGVECIDDWGGEEGGVYCRRPVWFGL